VGQFGIWLRAISQIANPTKSATLQAIDDRIAFVRGDELSRFMRSVTRSTAIAMRHNPETITDFGTAASQSK
jgi:hypothetical protein